MLFNKTHVHIMALSQPTKGNQFHTTINNAAVLVTQCNVDVYNVEIILCYAVLDTSFFFCTGK